MITKTCQRCSAEFVIDAKPTKIALAMASRYVRFCDSCVDGMEAESNQIAAEQRSRLVAARVGSLPKIFQGADWADDDGRHSAAFEAARNWATAGGTLVLIGPVGTGKSHLAALAAKTAMESRDVGWVSVPSLLLKLTASYGDQDRAHAMKAVTGRSALVLDDLDKTSASEWARAQLFAAIDNHIAEGSPLIVTANTTPVQMESKLGAAIASRLTDVGADVQVMAGADRRKSIRKAA